ncbi:AbrB/MazE/SpoVT family DNA-binding domain-containing protein [Rhizorhabdus wittichii]|jgi:AbrB family looped-hinge helix DNA binding protein|uniref:AbrB/MazE/SpoVT family DNA-binding domain-containing protein n=1 Tax=Rhizorhabdus wittichii TaxID=160791 RepID=A0A975HEC6_9SPHN|nr:AbrB/MazE/SpoVT family DNA-binding domain-containing protein [Rhizorhabdus wittichii]QTH22290.1 AbrB/MazE/SpoVT family DNA-binding domain-containing protein [Rhizorhabdus wittichii]
MDVSKLTAKNQVTIPADVRQQLGVKSGDHVAFEVEDGKVIVRKARAIDWAWTATVGSTLSEWSSDADEEAFRDL